MGAVPVAKAPAMVDASIGQFVQRHYRAFAQIQESRRLVNHSGMTSHGVAIGDQRLDGGLPLSQLAEDYTKGTALRVTSQPVVQPQPGQANYLLPASITKQAVDIGGAGTQNNDSQQTVAAKYAEI